MENCLFLWNCLIGRMENMRKLKSYIEKWITGSKVKGINVSPEDIYEFIYVYNSMVHKEKPEFINGKVKEILDKCGIKTVVEGIGWRVV